MGPVINADAMHKIMGYVEIGAKEDGAKLACGGNRLESGEHNPSIEMLVRLSRALGLEFAIDIRPADRPARYVTKQARTADAIADYEASETAVLFAAG